MILEAGPVPDVDIDYPMVVEVQIHSPLMSLCRLAENCGSFGYLR